jgi:hypothetical protein
LIAGKRRRTGETMASRGEDGKAAAAARVRARAVAAWRKRGAGLRRLK